MRFLTTQEAQAWCKGIPAALDEGGRPARWPANSELVRFVFGHEPAGRLFWISERLMAALDYWDEALLWVVESGVWGSSENTHLYYRVRQSYGDVRHLEQAPAHLALRHEGADMKTLLHLCMMLGWEAFLFTSHDYGRLFVSHDEYGEFTLGAERGTAAELRDELAGGGLKVETTRAAV